MDNDSSTWTITGGMDVVGSDGDKVGDVADVAGEYVVVSKGFFFPTDYYIPVSAISNVDDKVYLNVTKDDALTQGWDMAPEVTTTSTSGFADEPIVDPGLHIDNPVPDSTSHELGQPAIGQDPRGADAATSHIADADKMRVELAEEELTATTRPVERGAVQVDKVVTEEQQTLDVPVTEERVDVSRRVVDRDLAPGETTFEEGTIEVPVSGEEVDVEKRARVREEIEIGKEQVTGTQQVTDTVRREEARITDDTGEVVEDGDKPVR